MLIGGPPCQDFSMVISRQGDHRPGLNGGRGRLYAEYVRALLYFQSAVFVFENVPGLTSANSGEAYHTTRNDLQHLNELRANALSKGDHVPSADVKDYRIVFGGIVEGPRVGIPQTRNRLIMVGVRADILERAGGIVLSPLAIQTGADVADILRISLTSHDRRRISTDYPYQRGYNTVIA